MTKLVQKGTQKLPIISPIIVLEEEDRLIWFKFSCWQQHYNYLLMNNLYCQLNENLQTPRVNCCLKLVCHLTLQSVHPFQDFPHTHQPGHQSFKFHQNLEFNPEINNVNCNHSSVVIDLKSLLNQIEFLCFFIDHNLNFFEAQVFSCQSRFSNTNRDFDSQRSLYRCMFKYFLKSQLLSRLSCQLHFQCDHYMA
ncbi:hypothetical protein FGO68_gene4258 [Halteria grandinella]|uniref:Uncharacterized protein n=1 Tax=Halteria grandinella TaxID=5974 RepID=A0A8J8P3W1_HALGN|nr:hypothetical protein FGO68_gene4258 [Halteria grandinella]